MLHKYVRMEGEGSHPSLIKSFQSLQGMEFILEFFDVGIELIFSFGFDHQIFLFNFMLAF